MTVYSTPLHLLGKTKDTLKEMFLEDPLISALVMPEPDNPDFTREENWLGGTFGQTTLAGHCFDVPFIPKEVTDDRALLCLETNVLYAGNSVSTLTLTVRCLASDAKLRLTKPEQETLAAGYGMNGNRVDMMSEAVYRFFLNHPEVGRALSIGDIILTSEKNVTESLRVDNKYYGRILTFELRGFHLSQRNKRQAGI